MGGAKCKGGQAPSAMSLLPPKVWESWNSISSGGEE